MQYSSKISYGKTIGISLLFHCVLIVCLARLDVAHPIDKPAQFIAIEVIVNSETTITNKGEVPLAQVDSLPSSQDEQLVRHVEAVATKHQQLSPSITEEPSNVKMSMSVSQEIKVVEPGGSIGREEEKPNGGSGGLNNDDGDGRTAPKYRSGAKPTYPQAARKAGWEGAVVVRVLIDTDGLVSSASVKESSGYGILDEAAAQAVKKWRFSPARKGGVPITSFHDVRVRFHLDEAM